MSQSDASVVVNNLQEETHSQSIFNYEVFLPIIFALSFMLFLFIIYVFKNVDMRSTLRRRRRQFFCCIWKKNKTKSDKLNAINNRNGTATAAASSHVKNFRHQEFGPAPPNMNNYAKTVEFINGKNYVLEMDQDFKIENNEAIKDINTQRIMNNYRRSQNLYAQMPMAMPSHQKFINSHSSYHIQPHQQPQIGLVNHQQINYDYNNNQEHHMAVIAMQELKLNRFYQSEDNSDDFALNNNNNNDEDEDKNEDFDSMLHQSFKSSPKRHYSKSTFEIHERQNNNNNGGDRRFILRSRCDDLSLMENMNAHESMLKERRSYSNSKLDYHKWQRALTRRPAYNRIDQWSSYVLSEYELKKFLKKGDISHHECQSKDKLTDNENPLMVSSMITDSWSNTNNQSKRNHKCKSYSGGLHFHAQNHSNKQQARNSNRIAMAKLNKDLKSSNLFSSYSASNGSSVCCGLKSEARASTLKELDNGSDSSNNVIKRNSALVRLGHKLKSHLPSDRMVFMGGGSRNCFQHGSTNSQQKLVKSFSLFRDTNNYDENENKTTSALKLTNNHHHHHQSSSTRDSTYSRLCKSFTLLTRQSSFKQPRKKQNATKIKFTSEPVKLNNSNSSCNNTNIKRRSESSNKNQLNYLKNLNTFEQHIEIESLQLLVKKLENVTNLSALLKSIAKPSVSSSKSYNDAAVQTSMTYISATVTCADTTSSQSSSFNSHGTTNIMQTNCFGSIVGNFGSAMIQPSSYPSSRFGTNGMATEDHRNHSKFLRSHSDDYGLSTEDAESLPMLSSASSSKLTKLRLIKK